MSGASRHALEWALALLRAPGERHALRQQPLPPGVDALLGVAADSSPAALREAASSLGESEAKLREAAQFYAREVLFHPQANAYRTLGVAEDASHDQIKTHHRLLQLWLHPDRQRNDDDSVFASRVNIAWNRLRNEERRRAYDQLLKDESAAPVESTEVVGQWARPAASWVAVPARDPDESGSPWRQRAPVLALLGVCLFLGILTIRDSERQPEAWDASATDDLQAGADDGDSIPAPPPARSTTQAPATRLRPASVAKVVAAPPPARSTTQAPATRPPPASVAKVATAPARSTAQAPATRPPPASVAKVVAAPPPARSTAQAPMARPTPAPVAKVVAAPLPAHSTAQAPAARPPPASVAVAVPPPARSTTQAPATRPTPASVAKVVAAPPPARSTTQAPAARPPPASVAKVVAAPPPARSTTQALVARPPPASVAKVSAPASATRAALKPAAEKNQARAPTATVAVRVAKPDPVDVQAVLAQPTETVTATPANRVASSPDYNRIIQARQVGDELLGYFRKPRRNPPPIWNSPAIMSSANGMRDELHAQGLAGLDAPQWRIDASSATMTTAYRGKGAAEPTADGLLTVEMIWRENRWLVTGISMQGRR